jgi:DNA polymerase I-like protein with 3'-5' exonuclease and polymerase domains/5'-3' exonuclease
MLVDTSNVVKGAILHGQDKEFGRKVRLENGKDFHVNGADYGYDKAVAFLREKMDRLGFVPKDMIFVTEGPGAKLLRTSISDTYKATRAGKMPDEQYAEINKSSKMLLDQFLALGARTVTQGGIEADDVIAYLAQVLPESYIISTDGDLQQCISEKAHLLYDGKLDTQRYLHGIFPARFTTLYKSLVGDTSDNIKGAKGFGEKAFTDLYCIWGDEGLAEVERLIQTQALEELMENVAELKSLQRIVEDRDNVYVQYALARQYPEKVNTWRKPLEWRAGVVLEAGDDTHPQLAEFCAKRKIVHPGNRVTTLEWFKSNVKDAAYVGLDIETSAGEESDEWQARKMKKDPDSEDIGVDMFGHELTGMSLTFGPNDNYSLYFPVDHLEVEGGPKNVSIEAVAEFIDAIPRKTPIVVHHSAFELSVMERTVGHLLRDNGWHGFLPNVHDTRLLATYVDETGTTALKELSQRDLGYTQVTFEEVTKGRKMSEMTAVETFDYGTDDTRCTAALYNHYRCLMQIEGTFQVYLDVEQDPAYLTALAYNQGTPISMEKLLELEAEDRVGYDAGWAVLRQFLMENGWAGTTCPQAADAAAVNAAFIKEAFQIVTGKALVTQVRTPSKLVALIQAAEEADETSIGGLDITINNALNGDVDGLNKLLKLHFKGEPEFNLDSPVQKSRLLYEVMKLPVRLRNKATDTMRAKGQNEGNPRADDLAMQWALQNDVKPSTAAEYGTSCYDALKAVQAMMVAHTRQKMFYTPYKAFQHWKDNLVHANVTQNGAGTRRYTSSGPNLQQLPKHPKATGEPARFREVYVPHHSRAVIVAPDFSGQELRLIAEYSQDPNMLACYVGNDLKDMHSLTAAGILRKKALAGRIQQLWTMSGQQSDDPETEQHAFAGLVESWKGIDYAGFTELDNGPWKRLYKTLRALGKKTNFTTEYGAQAPRLAETLLVDNDEAQQYIEAKLAAFPVAEAWKQKVIEEEFHKLGYVTDMMGGRRHLSEALRSGNKWEIGKAERQGVNFKIQGSAAQMTKLAMGRVWRSGILFRYDARFLAPIHDELVFSVCIDDLVPFLQELHALMIVPYATMQVPIVTSIGVGRNFGQLLELGETVVADAVNDTIYELFPNEKLKEAA